MKPVFADTIYWTLTGDHHFEQAGFQLLMR